MANKTTKTDLYKIDPRNIKVVENFNSRVDFGDIQELAAQIAQNGVINPIHVRRIKGEPDKFTLVDGERRYRAVMYNIEQGLDVPMIPAIVMPMASNDAELIMAQILTNEAKNFNEYEYGVAFNKLHELGMSNKDIATSLGIKEFKVSSCMAHLKRDENVQELMKDGRITGVDVRHIYQSHKNDEEAVQTIMALKEMADSNNEHKIALKNLKKLDEFMTKKQEDTTGKKSKKKTTLSDTDFIKTIVSMDTTAIKNGLNRLWTYFEKMTPEQRAMINLGEVRKNLQNGMLIDEALGLKPTLKEAE